MREHTHALFAHSTFYTSMSKRAATTLTATMSVPVVTHCCLAQLAAGLRWNSLLQAARLGRCWRLRSRRSARLLRAVVVRLSLFRLQHLSALRELSLAACSPLRP